MRLRLGFSLKCVVVCAEPDGSDERKGIFDDQSRPADVPRAFSEPQGHPEVVSLAIVRPLSTTAHVLMVCACELNVVPLRRAPPFDQATTATLLKFTGSLRGTHRQWWDTEKAGL